MDDKNEAKIWLQDYVLGYKIDGDDFNDKFYGSLEECRTEKSRLLSFHDPDGNPIMSPDKFMILKRTFEVVE